MIEVKADALETTFAGVELGGAVARPLLSGARAQNGVFGGFLRSGANVEMKSFTGVSGDSGGYAIPREIDAVIGATLASVSPIRSIANVVQVGSAGYRKLVTAGGTPSGWASEVDARPDTGTPTYFEIAPPMGDLYANPSASQAMLDDALFDVEGWLATEIAREFARAEGAAFVSGSGVGRPKGFLAAPVSSANDGARAFGTLQYLASGAAGDFAASPQDRLIDLVQALRGPYRQNGTWVMNSATLARIRKFKTSDGAFIWTPGLSVGQPADAARLSGDRGGGHARHRRERAGNRVRRFPVGLSHRRAWRNRHPARSLFEQAVRQFLREQADRRLREQFGGDQADEVRGELIVRGGLRAAPPLTG